MAVLQVYPTLHVYVQESRRAAHKACCYDPQLITELALTSGCFKVIVVDMMNDFGKHFE
ncbi:MAG: hypothetical protein MK132_03280 [Lentisphaerales bacterium]|nr:hypothetical protein [Lentisphaerales bacterium]